MSIVITASEMKASIGNSKEECFDSLFNGRSAVAPLKGFQNENFNVKMCYEIDDRLQGDEKGRASKWLSEVIEKALIESKLDLSLNKVAVLVGTGLKELRSVEIAWKEKDKLEFKNLHFTDSIQEKIKQKLPVITVTNACAASNYMLAIAEDIIKCGDADAIIVAGVDSITESMFGLLDRVNPNKPVALQSFDQNRAGVIMGEGAAAIVIEKESNAKKRKVEVLAKVSGTAIGCDAFHETNPSCENIAKTIEEAHQRAGVDAKEIDAIYAHATGTMANDKNEALAIKSAWKDNEVSAHISGIKSMTGHTSGASGLMSVITAVEGMERGMLPGTVGLETILEEGQGLKISSSSIKKEIRHTQVNAFGFGGVNAVIMLEKCK